MTYDPLQALDSTSRSVSEQQTERVSSNMVLVVRGPVQLRTAPVFGYAVFQSCIWLLLSSDPLHPVLIPNDGMTHHGFEIVGAANHG
jgi:hypothetical protein